MLNYELIEKNKSLIINLGVIILALVIAFQLYKSANDQVAFLAQEQINELEKNKVVADIAALEKKAEAYKKIFVKKDLGVIMDLVSGIAKDSSVKIVSVKPSIDAATDNQNRSSFLVTLTAPSYHALGDFITKIENHKDVYMVSEVTINAVEPGSEVITVNVDLGVSLKISTISYL